MSDKVSNCCGSYILNEHSGEGVCSMCKEHCAADKQDDSTWQDQFSDLVKTADRIIARGKQIKETEIK